MCVKKKLMRFILPLLLIFLPACQTSGTRTPAPVPEQGTAPAVVVSAGDYFPAGPGSTWVYKGEGNEFASFKRSVLFSRNDQAQFQEDNGGTVSVSIYKITADAVTRTFYQAENYQSPNLLEKGYTSNDSTILLKAPLTQGASWNNKNEVRKISDMAARVQTPAGVFAGCIKVEIHDPNSTSTVYEYYQKNTGLVKREFIDDSNTVSSSLEKYQTGH